jgi:DNA-binding PadR family transcriptional regulator
VPKGQHLAEFELFVMSAADWLGDAAYGMSICREIKRRAGRRVAIGAVYATLARLGDKGLITTTVSDPLPFQGGRARKHVRLTPAGKRALKESMAMMERLIAAFSSGLGSRR